MTEPYIDAHPYNEFKVVGTIDSELVINAGLFVDLPTLGSVRVCNLNGSLTTGVTNVEPHPVNGSATIKAEKNKSGTHDVFIDLDLYGQFLNPMKRENVHLATLP